MDTKKTMDAIVSNLIPCKKCNKLTLKTVCFACQPTTQPRDPAFFEVPSLSGGNFYGANYGDSAVRYVAIFLLSPDGSRLFTYYVQSVDQFSNPSGKFPNYFAIPSGRLNDGEAPFEGAKRIFAKQTGMRSFPRHDCLHKFVRRGSNDGSPSTSTAIYIMKLQDQKTMNELDAKHCNVLLNYQMDINDLKYQPVHIIKADTKHPIYSGRGFWVTWSKKDGIASFVNFFPSTQKFAAPTLEHFRMNH